MERLKIIGEAVLGEKGFISVKEIAEKTGVPETGVRVVLDRLFREGLVLRFRFDPKFAPISRGRPKAKMIYQKKNKEEFKKRIRPKIKEGTASDRIWSVIRNKNKTNGFWTIRDVIVLAEVGREHARWFVKMLRRAGFVRQRARGEWILFRDPGPKRPYISDQKKKGGNYAKEKIY